jgi:mRNA-degrading endonuclease RelE of RelBE toxin-antitoxin system
MAANVLIAPQLFSSLAQLPPNDQARVIEFINTFQGNPAHPSLSLERVNRARSKGVWSGRVSGDLRAILHKDGETWAILYADHHDAAYDWAERREIGRHSVTGALQIVEAVETVREVEKVVQMVRQPESPPVFATHGDDYLLSLGVPETWLPTVRRIHDDDQLLVVCGKLPEEIGERLLSLASGEFVTPPEPVPQERPAIDAPDTRRRFLVVGDAEELSAALAAPMERWIAFLHPSQRNLVSRTFNGPVKVSGSAGTGKTVVAMHRARHLARQGERVLLTSFVTTLCDNIQRNLLKLCTDAERKNITISTVHKQALDIVRHAEPRVRPAADEDVDKLLETLRVRHAPAYDAAFIRAEWDNVVRLQGVATWDGYRQALRTGRGRGLSVRERKVLWQVFGGVLEALAQRRMRDWAGLCTRAEELVTSGAVRSPYTAVVVDEVQDLRPPDLRFLRALCAEHPGNLMVCGDAGQRIYPGGFSLGALGIDVRGRSAVLRINYRTTEQIRRVADRLLGLASDDLDGGQEPRAATRSLLRGPTPELRGYERRNEEVDAATERIRTWLKGGLQPEAIGVFTRTGARLKAVGDALTEAAIPWCRLSDQNDGPTAGVHVGTMHRAKGLEFKAVLVLDCGDGVVPSPAAARGDDDPQDREAREARERRLLYVAMTRARDELVVSWSGRPSRFIEPLVAAGDGGER